MYTKQQESQTSHENNSEAQSYEQEDQSQANDEANQKPLSLEEDKNFFQKHGMFFCGVCKNIMQPIGEKGEMLEFRCRRCGDKMINFKDRAGAKCMIHSRSLQYKSKKTEVDNKQIFDASMPRMMVECPECEYNEAVYMVVPEQGERRIIMRLICARGADENTIKCGKSWDLQQNFEVQENLFDGLLRLKASIEED